MSDDMFQEWLMSTQVLQRQSFGTDPATLEGAALAEYIRWNQLAAVDELMEALHEVDWKPWTVTNDGFRNRDAFVGELVDALHFVANLLVSARCTDAELSERYAEKQQKNRDRMASGTYDGKKDKCRICKRAFDDPAVNCYEVGDGAFFCVKGNVSGGITTVSTSPHQYTVNYSATSYAVGSEPAVWINDDAVPLPPQPDEDEGDEDVAS